MGCLRAPDRVFVADLLRHAAAARGPDVASATGRCSRGDQGLNFPKNFTSLANNQLFWPAVVFTLEYTVLVTILLIGAGPRPGAAGAGAQPLGRLPAHRSFLLPVRARPRRGVAAVLGLLLADDRPDQPAARGARPDRRPDLSSSARRVGALLSTTFLIVWQYAGFYMLILLVGLQGIPDEVYEAARIDGATRWQTFRRITLPLLRPSLALAPILCVTGSLLAFDQFYILTKGGPDNSTITVVQLIYRDAFQRQNLGTAAALSVIVLAVLLVAQRVQLRGLRGRQDLRADDAPAEQPSARTPVLRADRRARDHLPVPARSGAAVASVSPQAGTAQADRLRLRQLRDAVRLRRRAPAVPRQQRRSCRC